MEVIDKLKTGNENVVSDLEALQGEYSIGEGKDTLFNLAIRFNHAKAIDFFIRDKKLINSSSAIDENVKKSAKQIASQGVDLESTERALTSRFGEFTSFQRTPLMQACRFGNVDAIEKLVAAGAQVRKKDAVGYTPAELCLQSNNQDALGILVDTCIQYKQKPSISDTVLYKNADNLELYKKLITYGDLDVNAKRFEFSLACAKLDIEKVKTLIDHGFKPEAMVAEFYNPVYEACTSSMLNKLQIPGHQRLSPIFVQHNIFSTKPKAADLKDLLAAKTTEEYDTLVQEGVQKPAVGQLEDREFPWVPEAWLKEQMETRFDLVELLLKSNINVDKTTQCCSNGLIEDVALLGDINLLKLLERYGIDMEIEDEEELTFIANQLSPNSRAQIIPYLQQFLDC